MRHSLIVHCCKRVVLFCSQQTGGEEDERAQCMLGVPAYKEESVSLASSLTALLHPGHKASQRYLWSQLGHGGRRRSDRHWKPAKKKKKKDREQHRKEKREKAHQSPRMYRRPSEHKTDTDQRNKQCKNVSLYTSNRPRRVMWRWQTESWTKSNEPVGFQECHKVQIRFLYLTFFFWIK